MTFHRDTTGRGLHEPASYKVENNTGATLTKGTIVKRVGYTSVMDVATSTNPVSDNRVGIVLDDIEDGAIGYVGAQGDFGQFDTSIYPPDTILYSNGSGALSTTVLGDPVATVLKSSTTDGHLFCYMPLPIAAGSSSTGFSNYTYTLTPTDVSNGTVVLPVTPGSATDTFIQYEGAPGQMYGIDFTVSGNTLTFTGMLGLIASGETITILYR